MTSWLKSPVHSDPDIQLRAHIIHWISLVGIVTLIPLTAVLPILEVNWAQSMQLYVVAIVGVAICFVLVHIDRINAAAVLMSLLAWLVTMWASFATEGPASPQLSMGVLAIMLAGILLNGWGALVMAIAIAVSLLGIELLRDAGLLPQPFLEGTRVTVWAALSSVLILSAVLLNLYVNAMRAARESAAASASKLSVEMDKRLATEASLQRAERLEALGRLSGGIAHDFNNLLTVMHGESEMLELSATRGRHFSDKERDHLSEIRRATERATALTSQLLAFSRQQPRSPVPVEVDATVSHLESLLDRLIRANVNLTVDMNAGETFVSIDPSQLDQVLMNLALNASDAMPDGGDLHITTSVHENEQGSRICIQVSDTGDGIDPEHLEHIFDPFFTTKTVGQGTGLGLASTHGIVTAAQGDIEVESNRKQGTTVRVYLPIVKSEASQRTSKTTLEPTGELNVLLCEDDAEVRKIIEQMLELLGHEVIAVPDAEEALARITPSIDLIISDVILPGMNGVQLADKVRHLRSDLKILLISGYTADVLENSGIPDNIPLLQKPFTREGLSAQLSALTAAA